jgi:hypothetical protein
VIVVFGAAAFAGDAKASNAASSRATETVVRVAAEKRVRGGAGTAETSADDDGRSR